MAFYEGDYILDNDATVFDKESKNHRIKAGRAKTVTFVQEDLVGFQFGYRAMAFRWSTTLLT